MNIPNFSTTPSDTSYHPPYVWCQSLNSSSRAIIWSRRSFHLFVKTTHKPLSYSQLIFEQLQIFLSTLYNPKLGQSEMWWIACFQGRSLIFRKSSSWRPVVGKTMCRAAVESLSTDTLPAWEAEPRAKWNSSRENVAPTESEAAPAFVSAQQARPSFITSEWTHLYFTPLSLGIRPTEIVKVTSVCRSWPKNNHHSRRLEVFAWHLWYVMSEFRVKFNLKEQDDVVKLFWGQNSQEGRPCCSWFPDGVCVGCGADSQSSDWGKKKKKKIKPGEKKHIWQRIKQGKYANRQRLCNAGKRTKEMFFSCLQIIKLICTN